MSALPQDILADLARLQSDIQAAIDAVTVPSGPVYPELRPGHFVCEDPPLSVTCWATMFGLNWNGSIDSGDNGAGFFTDPSTAKAYHTRVKTLLGASLPREVMLSTFGVSDDWRSSPINEVWAHHAGAVLEYVKEHKPVLFVDALGHTLHDCPLVDAGPSRESGNGLDLTYLGAHLLDTQGKALCTYKIVVGTEVLPIKGWDWNRRRIA